MAQVKTNKYSGPTLEYWSALSLPAQMGNIGSEVSRALLAQKQHQPDRQEKAFYRALDLLDLSIKLAVDYDRTHPHSARTRELCLAREELCDYFAGDNDFQTNPQRLQAYYDQFDYLELARREHQSSKKPSRSSDQEGRQIKN